jgi:hypothetical protein
MGLGKCFDVCDAHYGAGRTLVEAAEAFGGAVALERNSPAPRSNIVSSREW